MSKQLYSITFSKKDWTRDDVKDYKKQKGIMGKIGDSKKGASWKIQVHTEGTCYNFHIETKKGGIKYVYYSEKAGAHYKEVLQAPAKKMEPRREKTPLQMKTEKKKTQIAKSDKFYSEDDKIEAAYQRKLARLNDREPDRDKKEDARAKEAFYYSERKERGLL
jgi:hypothetical protein